MNMPRAIQGEVMPRTTRSPYNRDDRSWRQARHGDAAFARPPIQPRDRSDQGQARGERDEPARAIGHYDPASGEHTLYTTSQVPHVYWLMGVSC